ncbi:hypothetical protein AKO1_011763 [Acrasis kona]|uniref:Uncharacterized protein n=1 Tax=Acrasis kona TaxID=1008807 RepID=A0AAW2Z7Q5_9EUKA
MSSKSYITYDILASERDDCLVKYCGANQVLLGAIDGMLAKDTNISITKRSDLRKEALDSIVMQKFRDVLMSRKRSNMSMSANRDLTLDDDSIIDTLNIISKYPTL